MAGAEPLPPSLRSIEVLIKRAAEYDRISPTVGYYCRVHALQHGIAVRDKADPNAQKYIKDFLQSCEAQRLLLSPNVAQHREEFMAFITGMFKRCVAVYRNGDADRNLALEFVKTGQLIEVSAYFGPLSDELQLMRKRCRGWAATISRDVKEERKPMPPPELVQQTDDDDDLGAEIDEQVASASASPSHGPAPAAAVAKSNERGTTGVDASSAPPRDHSATAGAQSIPPAPPLEEYGAGPPFVVPTPGFSGSSGFFRDVPPPAPMYPTTPDPIPPKPPSATTDVPQASAHDHTSGTFVAPPRAVHPPATEKKPEPVTSSAPKDIQSPGASSAPVVGASPVAQPTPVPAPAPKQVAQPKLVTPATAAAAVNRDPSYSELAAAQKKAKFAVSALDFSDVKTAVKELEGALAILKGA